MRSIHHLVLTILFAAIVVCGTARPSFASLYLMATGQDVGSQYVTLTSQGTITLTNTGAAIVHITNITSSDPDATGGYLRLAMPALPMNLSAGETKTINFTFAPNAPDIVSGARAYKASVLITSDAQNSPTTVNISGTGVVIRAAASIASTYRAKVGDTVDVPVSIDSWSDPLGTVEIRGMRVELQHYRRTIVSVVPSFNTGGAGQALTLTGGATVVEDVATDTLSDATHTSGEQGFYSLNIKDMAGPLRSTGSLLKMRFIGVKGTDTSRLNFQLTRFLDREGSVVPFVIMTAQTAGLITIDSIKKPTSVADLNVSPGRTALVLNPSAPNPFASATDISFTLQERTRADLFVCDVRGHVVATLVSGELSAGEHHQLFNAGTLPSGQYFAVLRTQAGIVKQDMALVR